MRRLFCLVSLFFVALPAWAVAQNIPAFPGAMGGGAESVGGRGGQIIEVLNLNDSGSGSLRACVEAFGPRICIFRLGGIIVNLSRLQVNNPFLTIAGQTAPGGGITIGGTNMKGEALFVSTHDVVVQALTCNGDNPNTPTGPDTGTVCFETVSGAYNVIFDKISVRWWGNKGWIIYSNDTGACCARVVRNITLQRSLVYEPNTTHPVGPGTDAASWPANATNIDFHHILFQNIDHRIPMVSTDAIRVVNTVTYNWGYFAVGMGGSSMDLVSNKWVPGNLNANNNWPHPVQAWMGQGGNCTSNCNLQGTASIYMNGNVGPQGSDYALTAEEPGTDAEGKPESATPIRAAWRRSTPLPTEPYPIVVDTPAALDGQIPTWGNAQGLDCSGNWVSHQDSQDARITQQYAAKGPGNTFTGQFTQPAVAPGTPCPEDPVNHLPLAYEQRFGIPAGTPPNTKTPSGETIFNVYLAGAGVTPPPVNPVSPNGTTVTPSGGSINDASGNVWTLGAVVPPSQNPDCSPLSCGNVILKNGTALTGTAATLLLWWNGSVYQENASGLWWQWNGSGFTKVGGDPRPPVNPVVTNVTVVCNPSSIPSTGTSSCSPTVQGQGAFNPAVTWSATGGAVTTSGVASPASGSVAIVVTATSVQTPAVSGKATIQVTSAPPPVFPSDYNCTSSLTKAYNALTGVITTTTVTVCTPVVATTGGGGGDDFLSTVNFSYDFTNFAPCSATVTTGCISGFKWGYLNGSGAQVALKTSPVSICTGTTQPEKCTDNVNSLLPMGSLTFYAVATFVDNAGTAGVTAPATTPTPTIITAPTPTNLTETST